MKQIPLGKSGKFALVDDEDYDFLMQRAWCLHTGGYASRSQHICRINGKKKNKTILMHRVILNPDDGMETDHIDRNKLNNQKSNLRQVTRSQNAINIGSRKGSSSNYNGVSFAKKYRKWTAHITIKGKQKNLGLFKSEIEAAIIYNKAAINLHGVFAVLNEVA